MDIDLKLDNESLFNKVQRNMLALLKNPVFAEKGKLPPEADLAQMLGVSRTVLRDVLSNLESHGFISRRRGIGTTINNHILHQEPRLDIDQEIDEIIKELGFEPKLEDFSYTVIDADPEMAALFGINEKEPLIRLERIISANGQAAVYSVERFPKKMIVKPYETDDLKGSILAFIEDKCNVEIETDLAKVNPVLAGKEIANKMGISEDTIMLHLDEINYDLYKRPVLWTQEYFVSSLIKFNLMRRKL